MFKPMLADNAVLNRLKFPIIASPKLDGVRAIFQGMNPVSRSLKRFPNRHLNERFICNMPFDGEFIVGPAFSPTVFRDTMKVVMSQDAPIDGLRFHAFDFIEFGTFQQRYRKVIDNLYNTPHMLAVPHILISRMDDLLAFEEKALATGYEGVMLRDPNGFYKNGRSTMAEGGLLKLKRKSSSEARVVRFEEQMHNGNEATKDNLGNTERSSHQENLTPMGVLGAIVVVDVSTGVEFNVGTGFSATERKDIWDNQALYLGQICSYEYLAVGVKDKPRHPVFKGWRDARDMSK